MTELTWFIFAVWVILLLFSYRVEQSVYRVVAALIGLFFATTLFTDAVWLGFILIMLNFYIFYTGIFTERRL